MDLQEIRGKLDQIDRQFVDLLEKRLDLCGQVAADKIKTGKAVFDKEREQQKLASVRAMAGNEFNARARAWKEDRDWIYHGGFPEKRSDQGGLSGSGRCIQPCSCHAVFWR